MSRAFIASARRTAVAPRRGAFNTVEAHDLAAPVLRACLDDAGVAPDAVDHVILGNALSGGGNVARLAALAAGLPDGVPALTIDTQCCSGLDAIILAARLVEAGAAEVVLAGGVESWSRAPLRARRPKAPDEKPAFYERPAFAPFPERDPDMIEAVAGLAREKGISRERQNGFAIHSHEKALAARERLKAEIVPVAGLDHDAFSRALTMKLCARAPVLAGDGETVIDATGAAVEADAAAAVLVVSERRAAAGGIATLDGLSVGGAPEQPAMALVPAVERLLARHQGTPAVVELMEAFAAQALANIDALGLDPAGINPGGGALARGHPIGASGAILAVRLFHELKARPEGTRGLAAIAAAGGLGAAMLLQRT
ncbi:acetyl-CoA acetyltransferase [Ancylobacter novellus DSM 506]|uniref:Acetyl-CoA acetyltransferase n=1 Tax=Ancylobacter novellus (strain ATCC 8093 / DSM 506 / JCM 20403 / CCM 1077 / IAM 12100 / NBRC 12443 / NCIMB 10456) TaxID=639283 RepID=D7A3Z5_ANCN5|nr:thiolase family protein [Ancylobacter novellus]ADH87815.1 acetyl-CoA acetyltransferase [Ancylobacter novellus DSM 506]